MSLQGVNLAGKPISRATQREHQEVARRKAKAGQLYYTVLRGLQKIPKGTLLPEADALCKGGNRPRPDRICRRQFEALICWFCDNLWAFKLEAAQDVGSESSSGEDSQDVESARSSTQDPQDVQSERSSTQDPQDVQSEMFSGEDPLDIEIEWGFGGDDNFAEAGFTDSDPTRASAS
jgi:hypothetical protein